MSKFEGSPARDPSKKVVDIVAEHEGINPTEITTPLYTVINPDALDDLFHGDEGSVTFPYLGYDVTVTADGTVTVNK